MLKWLGKILNTSTDSLPLETVKTAGGGAALAANTGKEEDKSLQVPSRLLDRLDEESGTALLTRQAIINRQHQLVGYEFSLRDEASGQTSPDEHSRLNSDELLVNTIQNLGADRLAKFRQLWLPIADTFLANPLIESMPAAETVLLFSIPALSKTAEQDLLTRAGELKAAGYKLALGNWTNSPAQQDWLGLLDYLVIDATAHNPLKLSEITQSIGKRAPAVQVMACQLESIEEFEFCQQARYHLFQGNFLTKRENWGRRPPISTDRSRLCDLLNRLRKGEEIADIAMQLRYSPTLSYRLLRYINSAATGLQTRVGSIESGLVFLGREKLYRWLTLLLFNVDDTKSTDGALLEHALARGRMMEILAAEKFSRQQCDELFVVGMFSLLDVLMKLPLSIALDPLQLPPTVAAALIDDSGDYAVYLRLAVACEENDFTVMKKAARALAFSVDRVNAAHFAALTWTQDALAPEPAENAST